ncbi:MAG: flavodoxin family protein [Deferribacteres bacterium]|nr:flavodoxin family protein [Deferribacteres bacterium]
MKILGMVVSARRLGNSEIAVREALMGAEEAGAETEIIRLTDYEIKPCIGCMRCAFKKEKCHIKDDCNRVYEKMLEADALILGVPDYILGAAGYLKMLLDRSMGYLFAQNRPFYGKPAMAIVPYGVKDWEGLTMPMVSIFLLSLGYRIVDQIMVRCQGPGEILFNEEVLERCHKTGKLIAAGAVKYRGKEGTCPVCHNNLMEIDELEVRCPICNIKGHIIIEDGKLSVKFEDPENHRWTPENIKEHFEKNVLPSGPRYMKLRNEIKERLKRYR